MSDVSPQLLLLISIALACTAGILSTPRARSGRRRIADLVACLVMISVAIVLMPIDARISLLVLDLITLVLFVFGPRARSEGPGGLSLNSRILLSTLLLGSVLGFGGLLGVAQLRSFDAGVSGETIPDLALKLRLGLTGNGAVSMAGYMLLIASGLRFMAVRPVAGEPASCQSDGSQLARLIVCLMPLVAAVHMLEFRQLFDALNADVAAAFVPLLGLWIALEGCQQSGRSSRKLEVFPIRLAAQQTCLILIALTQADPGLQLAGVAIAVLTSMELLALTLIEQCDQTRGRNRGPGGLRVLVLCSLLGIPLAARLYLESAILIGIWRLGTRSAVLTFTTSAFGLLMMKLWILRELTDRVPPIALPSEAEPECSPEAKSGGRGAVPLVTCAGVLLIQLAIPFWIAAQTRPDPADLAPAAVGKGAVDTMPEFASRVTANGSIRLARDAPQSARETRGAE